MAFEYHYSGSKASVNKDEPLWLTKYRLTFILPQPLQQKYGVATILNEQCIEVNGVNPDKLPTLQEQFYRGTKRFYVGTIEESGGTMDLELKFEVNVDSNNIIYPYNILRDWFKLAYDARTGYQLLKRDYAGGIILEHADKVGTVLAKLDIKTLIPMTPPNQFDFKNSAEGRYDLTVSFKGEDFTHVIIGD